MWHIFSRICCFCPDLQVASEKWWIYGAECIVVIYVSSHAFICPCSHLFFSSVNMCVKVLHYVTSLHSFAYQALAKAGGIYEALYICIVGVCTAWSKSSIKMDKPSFITKGSNFCDCQFASLSNETLQKGVYFQRDELAPSKFFTS